MPLNGASSGDAPGPFLMLADATLRLASTDELANTPKKKHGVENDNPAVPPYSKMFPVDASLAKRIR